MKNIFPVSTVYSCGHIALAEYGEPTSYAPDGVIKYLDCFICKNLELEKEIKELISFS